MQRGQRIDNKAAVATRSGGSVMGRLDCEYAEIVVRAADQRFVPSAGQFQQVLIHAV